MITLFKKKSYKRTALGLFIVVIFISVALTNAKAEDANPATVLNEEVTLDKQDWLWFNDYERSSDPGLVYDPDIKVEDKGYSFEIEVCWLIARGWLFQPSIMARTDVFCKAL